MNSFLSVDRAEKSFGRFRALDKISLNVEKGEFLCFLGPSGCGKTTLLRSIAGLETIDRGTIIQNGVDITHLPPSSRDFGIVFQSYALFPNLTVFDNVAYGIAYQKRTSQWIKDRVHELLGLVGLTDQEHKYPAQLSGGQQQRVALARAIAPMPSLLLLDEPLSALDAKVRLNLRRELRRIHKAVGLTTIMVTHDREEALTMADRIAVMSAGRIEQIGSPDIIYNAPANAFVADFISSSNIFSARLIDEHTIDCNGIHLRTHGAADVAPGHVRFSFKQEDASFIKDIKDVNNAIAGVVMDRETLGSFTRFYVKTGLGEQEVRIDVSMGGNVTLPEIGGTVTISIAPAQIQVYGAE